MLRTELTRIDEERVPNLGQEVTFSYSFDVINIVHPLSPEESLEIFDTSLSTEAILLLYVVGLGTTMMATGISVLYVVKMNPKKILMQGKIS